MIIKTNKFHFTNIACFLVTLKYRVKFVNNQVGGVLGTTRYRFKFCSNVWIWVSACINLHK